MSDVTVRELLRHPQDHVGQQVALCGWVRTVRDVKACAFIELNDGSVVKNVQVVCGNDKPVYEQAKAIGVGAALRVQANDALAANLKRHAADTLDKVLFELSSQMKNAYSRSDA